jgi:hypothetical protein
MPVCLPAAAQVRNRYLWGLLGGGLVRAERLGALHNVVSPTFQLLVVGGGLYQFARNVYYSYTIIEFVVFIYTHFLVNAPVLIDLARRPSEN